MGLPSTPAASAPFPEIIPCGVSGSGAGGGGESPPGAVGTAQSPIAWDAVQEGCSILFLY